MMSRANFRWATFGVSITAFFLTYQLLTDAPSALSRNSELMILFVILCPPSLLSIAFDPEVGTNGFYALWAVVAIMNAGLYATIRALVLRRLQRPD